MPQRAMLLLPLLASLAGLAVGEVMDERNFNMCNEFFYQKSPPAGITGGRYAFLCQRYKNKYRFATLYDRHRRTPLYSAYLLTYDGSTGGKRNWMYEPQLASLANAPQMKRFRKFISVNVKKSQAVLKDYINSSYTRGHLNPRGHNQDDDDQLATFTLTNIVPQQEGSNKGPWKRLEVGVKTRLGLYCNQTAYVITGVLPYAAGVQRSINNRVAVPEYMWSAYCCPPSYNASLPEEEKKFFPTYAAVGRNDNASGTEIVPVNPLANPEYLGYDVKRMPLAELEGILRERLVMPDLSLFQGQCLQPANPIGGGP